MLLFVYLNPNTGDNKNITPAILKNFNISGLTADLLFELLPANMLNKMFINISV
tara:strand:+ start:405 stop:566 length:162 start_codon:yes stop_codon:yes gene_type:complete